MSESKPNGRSTQQMDALADDPFFKRKFDGEWNACIGKQGDEENYLDGYIEAAMELADALIGKEMFDKRDTLVLPILYNARHALELTLKFTSGRLMKLGRLRSAPRRDHNIQVLWELLNELPIGDEELSRCLGALGPFVTSLSKIDNDGQELRYHMTQSGDESMSTYSLANLEVIRDSLKDLSQILSLLKRRIISYVDECGTGTYTGRCSRRDLIAIAHVMPPIEFWKDLIFDERKEIVKGRFRLSNQQFSKALEVMKGNREMKAILGVQTNLEHISDDSVVWVVEQWRNLHRPRGAGDGIGIDYFSAHRLEGIEGYLADKVNVIAALQERLTQDELADLEVIFYFGRDGWFSEYYTQNVATTKRQHAAANDARAQVEHLMEKTNFLTALRLGVKKLGRLSLAEQLASL